MKHAAREAITREPVKQQRPPAQCAMTRAGASGPRRRDALVVPAAFVLLAVLAWQVLAFIRASSRTSDESAHIMAGYSYLTRRDFRLNPEHPPLIKEMAAVPLLFLNLRFPEGKDWDQGDQWNTGQRFIHEQRELVREQLGQGWPLRLSRLDSHQRSTPDSGVVSRAWLVSVPLEPGVVRIVCRSSDAGSLCPGPEYRGPFGVGNHRHRRHAIHVSVGVRVLEVHASGRIRSGLSGWV